jgi:hypothetical protein
MTLAGVLGGPLDERPKRDYTTVPSESNPVRLPWSGPGGDRLDPHPVPAGTDSTPPDYTDEIEALRYLFPAWPDEVLAIYAQEWVETGDANLALARVQASEPYARAFPGLVRDDGSLRFQSAQDYLAARTRFDAMLTSIGINSAYFSQTFVDLLNNEVSDREMIDRIEAVYVGVMDRSPELRAFYALPENGGLGDISDQALIASVLDPRIGEEIINRRISIAEIGAEATTRSLGVDFSLIERLYEIGTTAGEAGEVFSQATDFLPVLSTLARRHNDPDDDFDLNEFVGAQLLDDPVERRRMRQLLSREKASFSSNNIFTTDRTGAIRGLSLGL